MAEEQQAVADSTTWAVSLGFAVAMVIAAFMGDPFRGDPVEAAETTWD
jgi:hypothetical protein